MSAATEMRTGVRSSGRRRAVLVAPRAGGSGETPTSLRATIAAMEMLERAGFELAGIIDPQDHLEALRLVVDGLADIIVATRPDHLPALRMASDEAWFAHPARTPDAVPEGAHRRSRRLLRPEDSEPRKRPEGGRFGPGDSLDHRRPEAVDPVPEPEVRPVPVRQRRPQPVDGRRRTRMLRQS